MNFVLSSVWCLLNGRCVVHSVGLCLEGLCSAQLLEVSVEALYGYKHLCSDICIAIEALHVPLRHLAEVSPFPHQITKVMLLKGWRCVECIVCEVCGQASDPSRLLLCDDCDISYHTYCLDPPLLTVPKGGWKCKW